MRFALTMSLFAASLFAYGENDTLSQSMRQKLQLEPNKITIVDFFASWCGSCKKEIPYISKLNKSLDENKYEIIGIDVDKDINDGKTFQKELKAQGNLNFRVIDDPENEIVKEFNPIGMPALYYVKNGTVVKVLYGAIDNIDEVILNDLKVLEQ